MSDSRYNDLKAVARYEGLNDEEQYLITDYMEAPASAAYNLSLLLRGALAQRGNMLDHLRAKQMMGVAAGRVVLGGLLNDSSQCERWPGAPLTAAEWQRGTTALNAPDVSCERLLALLLGTRRAIGHRQYLTAAKTA